MSTALPTTYEDFKKKVRALLSQSNLSNDVIDLMFGQYIRTTYNSITNNMQIPQYKEITLLANQNTIKTNFSIQSLQYASVKETSIVLKVEPYANLNNYFFQTNNSFNVVGSLQYVFWYSTGLVFNPLSTSDNTIIIGGLFSQPFNIVVADTVDLTDPTNTIIEPCFIMMSIYYVASLCARYLRQSPSLIEMLEENAIMQRNEMQIDLANRNTLGGSIMYF